MKKSTFPHYRRLKTLTLFAFALSFCVFLPGGMSAKGGEIFSTDFSTERLKALGWETNGVWKMKDFAADKPGLEKDPGPCIKFPANIPTPGMLTKKFDPIANPDSLTLTFEAGYGWGSKNHGQRLAVMILDADGNGYIFSQNRSKSTQGAQWDKVTKYTYSEPMQSAAGEIDTTEQAVIDGGGLRTFTITRDADGDWSFNGDTWTGGPLTFTDKTYTTFSQVVLVGTPNSDDLLYNKVKLEAK